MKRKILYKRKSRISKPLNYGWIIQETNALVRIGEFESDQHSKWYIRNELDIYNYPHDDGRSKW
jgi:hypothetical protein